MSVEKKKLHINILELLTVKNGILAFTKIRVINAIYIQIGNTSFVRSENGTYDRQETSRLKQGYLGIFAVEADYNHCRILPTHSEHKIRLTFSSQQGLLGVEIISNSIPKYVPENEDPMIDLFASKLLK